MPRFSADFLDELRSRLRASDIIGRHVRLKKEGREWRGLSPFNKEKTPSFFVNDDKARYFDFSSGKSGDIIGFLVDSQNLSFPEAVTRLAEEAGMEIPKDTPEDRVRQIRATGLREACEAAAAFFAQMIRGRDGRPGRDYLAQRGVRPEMQAYFSLGFAPAARNALKDHLLAKGFSEKILCEAGLLIDPDAIDRSSAAAGLANSYDRFRNRVMFPITDRRGQVIAFGGRALDTMAKAKYLNSPETPLFHKGHVLYNYARARAAAARLPAESGQPLIVCEGYMDVIAMTAAGYANTLAPLGTAMTAHQLGLLWHSCNEPILCLDGDRAGRQAAFRAIDRALPLLAPGKSLRFAFLPEGRDPDDFLKSDGPAAIERVLKQARGLADVLFDRERETIDLTTPERHAAFKSQLRRLVGSIAHPDVRAAYGRYFQEKLGRMYHPVTTSQAEYGGGYRGGQKGREFKASGGGRMMPPIAPSAALKKQSAIKRSATLAREAAQRSREALLVILLINHPALYERFEDEILALALIDPDLSRILAALLDIFSRDTPLDRAEMERHLLGKEGLSTALRRILTDESLQLSKFVKPGASLEEAAAGWSNILALYRHHGPMNAEITEAASEASLDDPSEARWRSALSFSFAVVAEAGSFAVVAEAGSRADAPGEKTPR